MDTEKSFREVRGELWARELNFKVVMISSEAIRLDEHIKETSIDRKEERYRD